MYFINSSRITNDCSFEIWFFPFPSHLILDSTGTEPGRRKMTRECVPLSFSFFCCCFVVLSVLIPYSEKRSNKMPVLFNTILEFVDADYELRKNSYACIKGTLLHFVYLDTVLKFYWLIFYKFKIIILTSLFFKLKQTFYVLQHIFCVGF